MYIWDKTAIITFTFCSWPWCGGVSTVQQKEFGEKRKMVRISFLCFLLKYNSK